MRPIAKIISRIFDPIFMFSIAIIVAALHSGMSAGSFVYFITAIVLFVVAPPAAALLWAIKTKRVSDIDVSNRSQRVRVFFVFGFFLLADYFVLKQYGNIFLQTLFSYFILWFAGFFAITLFWKISGHLAGLTLVLGLFYTWYGSLVVPFFILLPLLAWSRIITKNHTLMQVIAGVLYSFIFLYASRQSIF